MKALRELVPARHRWGQLAAAGATRARVLLRAVAPALPGILGFAMVTRGVWKLWGEGVTWIVVGMPLLFAYLLREAHKLGLIRFRRIVRETDAS